LVNAAAALQTASIDSNPDNGNNDSRYGKRRKSSQQTEEPILKSLHILQRGGLGKHQRSGYCQGGLTSSEVTRKLEMQQDNYTLMNRMSQVTLRKNKYVDNDSRSGKMMT